MKKQRQTITDKLNKSPISYFSDLFIAAMVVVWLAALVITVAAAIYATVVLGDTSIWAHVETEATIPLSAGGAIWMIKNSVQHAIANSRGKRAHEDFPTVPDTDIEFETEAEI